MRPTTTVPSVEGGLRESNGRVQGITLTNLKVNQIRHEGDHVLNHERSDNSELAEPNSDSTSVLALPLTV